MKSIGLKVTHYKWSDKYYLKKYCEKLKIYAMNLEKHEKKINGIINKEYSRKVEIKILNHKKYLIEKNAEWEEQIE